MPSLACYVQRVRYPNGSESAPFIVPMCIADMKRFAIRVLEDDYPDWQGCLTSDGRVDSAKMQAKISADDFPSGSSRFCLAHEGRFWATMRLWTHHGYGWDAQIGPILLSRWRGAVAVAGDDPTRLLSMAELALLFYYSDETGWDLLNSLEIATPCKAFARTVLAWLPQIEELA